MCLPVEGLYELATFVKTFLKSRVCSVFEGPTCLPSPNAAAKATWGLARLKKKKT